jgi:predicted glycoside hydrolase/deacetylase ChbG (UPF0249 family)
VKNLIVNADDFGHSPGINRGIVEAHELGIVTSASLMVDERASGQAALLGASRPQLSLGLHVKITDELARPLIELADGDALRAELMRQVERFRVLVGRDPQHLDSHHNVHLLPPALAPFAELASSLGITLRGRSEIRYFSSFFGQWDGETHLEQIGVASLLEMLEREVGEGVTELGCHPGYVDAILESTYAIERETELRTLCDARAREALDELGIVLVDSTAARRLVSAAGVGR